MVRIAALTLLMAVIAITGFTSTANAENQGRGGVHNCNNCQVFARSNQLESRKKGMQCVRQAAKHIVHGFSFQGAQTSYKLSTEKSTRAHVGDRYDIIKNVNFRHLEFYPNHQGGFEINEIPCNNGMVGYVSCKNCIDGSNP